MASTLQTRLQAELDAFRREGVYKRLNVLDSPQAPVESKSVATGLP